MTSQRRRFEAALPALLAAPGSRRLPHAVPGAALDQLACSVCGRAFNGRNRRQDLERHVLTHTGVKPFQCPHCPHRTNRIGNLKTHVFTVHRDLATRGRRPVDGLGPALAPPSGPVLAPPAGPPHAHNALGAGHVLAAPAMPEGEMNTLPPPRFLCPGIIFFCRRFPSATPPGPTTTPPLPVLRRRPHCFFGSSLLSFVKRNATITCAITSTRPALTPARPRVHGRRDSEGAGVRCPVCGRFITGVNRKQNLERHMLTHSGERPFRCPYCPHGSNRVDNLKLHIRRVHLLPASTSTTST
ncbi:zinc finger protein 513-like [Penaeus indicus]|uniref:zinc finger protein 513-like n=1 Tax=Penaeus indicus TaxID=29960 RepID=UPI00300D9EF0